MPDPDAPPLTRSMDPGDDYLLVLREQLPIHSPSSFLARMKVSVSLPGQDVEFLDAYAREQGLESRSAALHRD